MNETTKMPTIFLAHGGGPCFFMEWTMGPPNTWHELRDWLTGLLAELGVEPAAFLIVSAHWEAPTTAVTGGAAPELIYDYYGFPDHTYELTWPAPGDPELAEKTSALLSQAGLPNVVDQGRGFDHGVFVPMKLVRPEADIPTVALSLRGDLDPLFHLEIGHALAPLRDEGVLIIGSGFSYHNFDGYMTERGFDDSVEFDQWLTETSQLPADERWSVLSRWEKAPKARASHPREEHLLPLMVAAGAADETGARVSTHEVMGVQTSNLVFG